jgi:hypothetical protein
LTKITSQFLSFYNVLSERKELRIPVAGANSEFFDAIKYLRIVHASSAESETASNFIFAKTSL